MNLENIDLLKLQTKYMQEDTTTQGFCAALTPQLKLAAGMIKNSLILARINELPESILDELAYELHVEWYDAAADIGVKRELIKNSDKVHIYMGTPYAIEQVVQDYFGDGYVEEWFQYEGHPYHFRVVTSNPSVTGDQAELFFKAVEKVKRRSTVMDNVIVDLSAQLTASYACAVQIGDFYITEQVV